MTYSILGGNVIRFHLTFKDDTGALADPTTVTLEVGTAYSDVESLSVVQDDTGKYHADWDTTGLAAGVYYALAVGSGAITATREISVRLRGSHLSA